MRFNKKKIGLIVVIVFIAIQYYRPNKNQQMESTLDDFLLYQKAPKNIVKLMENSCYNCHSNFTKYYWYNNIAPVSWYIDSHTEKAKEGLNLSDWAIKDVRDKRAMLSAIAFNISEDKMPLPYYILMHPDAELSEKDKKEIMDWLYTIELK